MFTEQSCQLKFINKVLIHHDVGKQKERSHLLPKRASTQVPRVESTLLSTECSNFELSNGNCSLIKPSMPWMLGLNWSGGSFELLLDR